MSRVKKEKSVRVFCFRLPTKALQGLPRLLADRVEAVFFSVKENKLIKNLPRQSRRRGRSRGPRRGRHRAWSSGERPSLAGGEEVWRERRRGGERERESQRKRKEECFFCSCFLHETFFFSFSPLTAAQVLLTVRLSFRIFLSLLTPSRVFSEKGEVARS